MKRLFLNFLIIVLLIIANACDKVKDLSDEVGLDGFEIVSHSPADIELGTPVIKGDTVYIPVLKGAIHFPLTINCKPIISGNTEDVIKGPLFESFSNIVFEQDDSPKDFYLIAKSGLPQARFIALDIIYQEKQTDIKEFNINNASNTFIAPQAFLNPIKSIVELLSVNPDFPLIAEASAVVAEKAKIKDAQNNILDRNAIKLEFGSITDTITLKVEAENGDIQDWDITMKATVEVSENTDPAIINSVSVNHDRVTAAAITPGFEVLGIMVNQKDGIVTFNIRQQQKVATQNIEILPQLNLSSNIQTFPYLKDDVLTFRDFEDEIAFYILDSATGYYKRWIFKLAMGDMNDIYQFDFTYTSNAPLTIKETVISNANSEITIYLSNFSNNALPIAITPTTVVTSEGASNTATGTTFNFESLAASHNFTVTGLDGIVREWSVRLVNYDLLSSQADVTLLRVAESSHAAIKGEAARIDPVNYRLAINLTTEPVFPVNVQFYIEVSEAATVDGLDMNSFYRFNSFNHLISFNVIAENGTVQPWTIVLTKDLQLPNSDFELWIDKSGTNMNAMSIDPVPGVGKGWATANNPFVLGSLPVANASGNAAQLTTGTPAFPSGLLTAGTLFLGKMDMSTLNLDNPRSMTKFGIPFDATPQAVKIDAKYKPGPRYQQSVKSGLIYKLEDREGEDRGQIWIELVHWSGIGEIDYSGIPKDGVTVLSRGELILAGESNWNKYTIDLFPTTNYNQYTPTHLVVVMASSIDGHLFLGAKESVLTVDNFELIYQ